MRRAIMPMALALVSISMTIAACNGGAPAEGNGDQDSTPKAATAQSGAIKEDSVPYTVAENYFVNNSVKDSVPDKITGKEDFDKYFGMASTMGADGTPTPIDFDKQYVIVVNHPTTSKKTEIIPLSLIRQGDNIVFDYKIIEGEEMSFSIHPLLMLVVDNQYNGTLVLQKK